MSVITVIALTLLSANPDRVEFSAKEKGHWAFQPVSSPEGDSIDTFIHDKLKSAKLTPATPASKRQLIRRVTFDLIGLPPTIEEIDAFVADDSDSAWETVVDRLLASPHYGERWGRHWLDVARYADSNGLDENTAFANAWKYRDHVVNSFNSDKPYDQFLKEQIAGDLMPTDDYAQRLERLTATGYLAIGPKFLGEADKQKLRLDIADEQLDTLGRGVMALTLGCAKCHDHKFDPIPTSDYYSLLAIFTSTQTMQTLDTVAKAYEHPEGVLSVTEGSLEAYGTQPRNLHVQIRGDYTNPGDEAPARFPQILPSDNALSVATSPNPDNVPEPNMIRYGKLRASSGRLELAEWLTNGKHPLTARVMVNRIWAGHFGDGLVRSVNNFGMNGEQPTHPELLDWLATKFVDDGWSIKKLHKRILLSDTYQRSGTFDKQSAEVDPENRLLWRFPRRRLDAETIRDSILFVAGNIDLSLSGTIWYPNNLDYISNVDFNSTRRSLYLPVIRGEGYAFFDAFDFPDASAIAGTRKETVVPTQALFLMNDTFVDQQALFFAQRLQMEPTREGRIRLAYSLVYGREATDVEVKRAGAFIDDYQSVDPARYSDEGSAWQAFCQALFASNEFLYVE